MNIIKLNAIDSTNIYLKNMVSENEMENYTVAVARHQTAGRGQMGTNWVSDKNKNLTFSLLARFEALKIHNQFYVSMAVAIAVVEVLKKYVKSSLVIKWPNDILADKNKVCGILIENSLKGNFLKHCIIGIGLNVNQEIFPSGIGKVSSLKLLANENFETDEILINLINSLKKYINLTVKEDFKTLEKLYYSYLFKYKEEAVFIDSLDKEFKGKIIAIGKDGRLEIELKDKKTRKYNLKEIKLASSEFV